MSAAPAAGSKARKENTPIEKILLFMIVYPPLLRRTCVA
jgi:hypothetical protein